MANLPDLPTELIELIFAAVDNDDHATLAAICLSSKLGYGIAVRKLYHTATNSHSTPDPDRSTLPPLVRQCKAMAANPKLAGLVRTIVLDVHPNTRVECAILRPLPEVNRLLAIISARMQGLELDQRLRKVDVEYIRCQSEYYLVALLALCPNVESIRLIGALHKLGEFQQLRSILSCLPSPVRKIIGLQREENRETSWYRVRDVYLSHDYDDYGVGLQEVEDLLWFPCVQSMTIRNLSASISWGSSMEPNPRMSSRLRQLTLTQFSGNNDELDFLFRSCPALQMLSVTWTCSGDENWKRIDWMELGMSFKKHGAHLQHLVLDHAETHDDEKSETESLGLADLIPFEQPSVAQTHSFGFLSGIRQLQTATVPAIALKTTGDEASAHRGSPPLPPQITIITEVEDLGDAQRNYFDLPHAHRISLLSITNRTKTQHVSRGDAVETLSV